MIWRRLISVFLSSALVSSCFVPPAYSETSTLQLKRFRNSEVNFPLSPTSVFSPTAARLTAEKIQTWQDVHNILKDILKVGDIESEIDRIRQLSLILRNKGNLLKFKSHTEYTADDYPDDIAPGLKRLAVDLIRHTPRHHRLVVQELILALPYDQTYGQSTHREIWGLAEDLDDWNQASKTEKVSIGKRFSEELRGNIHRAHFSIHWSLYMVRFYLHKVKTGNPYDPAAIPEGEEELFKRYRTDFDHMWRSPSGRNDDIREMYVESQKENAPALKDVDSFAARALDKLEQLERHLTILHEGILRSDLFGQWQEQESIKNHASILAKLQKYVSNDSSDVVSKLLDLLELRNEVLKVIDEEDPETVYHLFHFLQALSYAGGALVNEFTVKFERNQIPTKDTALVIHKTIESLYLGGSASRYLMQWDDLFRLPDLTYSQLRDVTRVARNNLTQTAGEWVRSYHQAASGIKDYGKVETERAVGMLFKEKALFRTVDRLLELMKEYTEDWATHSSGNFIDLTRTHAQRQEWLNNPYGRIVHIDSHTSPSLSFYEQERARYGGKGNFLNHMHAIGGPVPSGFIFDVSIAKMNFHMGKYSEKFSSVLDSHLRQLEKDWGKKTGGQARVGDPKNPLFLAIRSGSTFIMPGILETVIDIGFTPDVLAAFEHREGTKAAYSAYSYFLESFAEVLESGLSKKLSDRRQLYLMERNKRLSSQLTPYEMKELTKILEALIRENNAEEFDDAFRHPEKQVILAVNRIVSSWEDPISVQYRKNTLISNDWHTPIIVQAYVFGDTGTNSGTGLVTSRNSEGELEMRGEWLEETQGKDLVSGQVTPKPVEALREIFPEVYRELRDFTKKADEYTGRPVQIEFTVEQRRLWILQVSYDHSNEHSVEFSELEVSGLGDPIAKGRPIFVRKGGLTARIIKDWDVLNEENLEKTLADYPFTRAFAILRPFTTPAESVALIDLRNRLKIKNVELVLVTQTGGVTSHAAVTAIKEEIPALIGANGSNIFSLPDFSMVAIDFTGGKIYPMDEIGARLADQKKYAVWEEGGPRIVHQNRLVGMGWNPVSFVDFYRKHRVGASSALISV